MRTPGTSLSHLVYNLILDNIISLAPETRAEIRELWRATLGPNVYFDIRPRSQLPEVKYLIPVRHYARNDAGVSSGPMEFLEKVGRDGSSGTTKRYLPILGRFSGPLEIESTKGLHI